MSRHGSTTGEPLMSGYFSFLGLHVQRSRIKAEINRVTPRNTGLYKVGGITIEKEMLCTLAKFPLKYRWPSFTYKMEVRGPWLL